MIPAGIRANIAAPALKPALKDEPQPLFVDKYIFVLSEGTFAVFCPFEPLFLSFSLKRSLLSGLVV